MSDLTHIAKLIDDLKHDEVHVRVSSSSQLPTISAALGPERTRDELIPFLVESTDDEDEVLVAMAEQLGAMVSHVGGPSFAHFLLPPLIRLAVVEEASVRDRAVQSLTAVVANMTPQVITDHWHPALFDLCKHDNFTARISACALCGCGLATVAAAAASAALRAESSQQDAEDAEACGHVVLAAQRQRVEVRHAFAALCRDDTPMVRRVAYYCLGALATLLSALPEDCPDTASALTAAASTLAAATAAAAGVGEGGGEGAAAAFTVSTREQAALRVGAELLDLFAGPLMEDRHDSVRLQSASTCVALAKLFAANKAVTTDKSSEDSGSGARDGAAAAAAAEMFEASNEGGGGGAGADAFLGKVFSVFVTKTCGDPHSWRVRWSAVMLFDEVASALGASPRLIQAFEALLKDPEVEVRTAAAASVAKVTKALLLGVALRDGGGDDNDDDTALVLDALLPAVRAIASDPSEHVRASVASSVAALAPVLGRDHTIARLLPVMLQLLRDTNSEVRLNVVRSLGDLHSVIGVDLLAQSLLPTVLELATDAQWRVRLAILQRMPSLAAQIGADFFSQRLAGQCFAWLLDDVSSVRSAAIVNLRRVCCELGEEWTVGMAVPHLTDMAQAGDVGSGCTAALANQDEIENQDENENDEDGFAPMATTSEPTAKARTKRLLSPSAAPGGDGAVRHPSTHRTVAIKALEALSTALPPSPLSSSPPLRSELVALHVLPVLLHLCTQDPVPNVRFNAAKALAKVTPLLAGERGVLCQRVTAALTGAAEGDADVDVRFFAARALREANLQ